MTTSHLALGAWATRPLGKAARIGIAVGGLVTATLVLTTSAVVTNGSWALVLLGVALAAASVRAARIPSVGRLTTFAVGLIAIPILLQTF